MAYRAHRRQLTIEWGHCDPAGIVFCSRFFEYFDWNTACLFQSVLGLSKRELQVAYDADMPLVDVRARYLVPCYFCDIVEIESSIKAFRRSSFDVQHRLFKHGKLAVDGQETRVWVGPDPENPAKVKSKPVPAEIIARFQAA